MENLILAQEIRQTIEKLEQRAVIYSSLDRVRFNELMTEIKAQEMILLDLMSADYSL